MALKDTNYYKATFDGGQEFIIEHSSDKVNAIIGEVSDGLLNTSYIVLQYQQSEPIHIKKDRLFSIQKVPQKAVGHQTRIWRLK